MALRYFNAAGADNPVIRCVAATLDSIVEGRHSLLVFGFGPEFHQSSDRLGA
jgi:hypothetical protein